MPFYTPFTDRRCRRWHDRAVMKTQTTTTIAALALFTALSVANPAPDPCITADKPTVDPPAVIDGEAENRIQIAILLDTSSSMDGLIDQAKTQLWKVVNTFIEAKHDGKAPFVEVALYEYGNNNNAAGNDWIRLVSPMTRDLDQLSRDLFALKTNGGGDKTRRRPRTRLVETPRKLYGRLAHLLTPVDGGSGAEFIISLPLV